MPTSILAGYFSPVKNTWIGNYGTSCHVPNLDRSICVVANIDALVQGSPDTMRAMKYGKPLMRYIKYGIRMMHRSLVIKYSRKLEQLL